MNKRIINLTIVSDVVCAWCYIGMARLHRAFDALGDVEAAIAWRPFELNPEIPAEGVDRVAYFDGKFGANARGGVEARVLEAAVEAGLPFDWGSIRRMPSSRKAHILIHHAAEHGAADAVHNAVMRAHFAEGRDIGSTGILQDIAAEQGLDSSAASRALCDPARASMIEMEELRSVRAGVRSVPFFVMADRVAFSGAIDSRDWQKLLTDALVPAEAQGC